MAELEQFRYTGECMACLSPAELRKISVPDEFNPHVYELETLERRFNRSLAKTNRLSKIIDK